MKEFLIFLACAASGALIGAADRLLAPARRKLGIVFTVFFDVLAAALAFAALLLPALFLSDGVIQAQNAVSLCFGFFLPLVCFRGRKRKTKRRLKKTDAQNP